MEYKEDKDFNNFIEEYKKLNLLDKKKLVINEINDIIIFLNKLNVNNNIKDKVLFNKEILDIQNNNFSEVDFVEAIFVYLYSIKDLLANYVEKKEV